jgi:hypothetical protein
MKYLPLDVKQQLINEPLTNQPEQRTWKQVIGENEEYEHYQHLEVNRGTPEG